MADVDLYVVSTAGFDCPAEAERRCIASVSAQLGVTVAHLYCHCDVEDYFPTMIETIGSLPPNAIVANLDGDDWLGPEDSLAKVVMAHDCGALVTYGSFIHADGRPGFAAPYAPDDDVRVAPWRGTHLKTFRAGLFQAIYHRDLRDEDGKWLMGARDQAFMLPMLEMAGHDRRRFIKDILYVYNFANAGVFQSADNVKREREAEAVVRAKPNYRRINWSPPCA